MLKYNYTKQEIEDINNKIYLTELQQNILEYRIKEYSIAKMSILECVSESTISREIRKLKDKLTRI